MAKDAPAPVTNQTLKAATDTDGLTYGDFERDSARKWYTRRVSESLQQISRADKKGKKFTKKQADQQAKDLVDSLKPSEQAAYMKQWKQAFIDRLSTTGYKSEASTLTSQGWVNQTPGSGSDALKGIYDGKSYDGYRQPLMKSLGTGLTSDPDWQPETSASFINKDGEKTYANPKDPYWVSDGKTYPVGTFAKVTGPNGQSIFARALDTNGKKGVSAAGPNGVRQLEGSPGLFEGMGYSASGTSNPDGNFGVNVFPGSGGDSAAPLGYLTNDETQEAGKLIEDGTVKSIRNRDDLERARKLKEERDKQNSPATPPVKQKTGLLLRDGFTSVYHGREQYEVGYAAPDCVHDGGGHVAEGSCTVYAGKYPLARIGDKTSDNLNVVSGGLDTWVGGAPTSTKLA